MKLTEFWRAVDEEFGAGYGRVLTADLSIPELGDRTADQAIADGLPPRDVWLALCQANQVPKSRWYGAGKPQPKRAD